MMYDLGINKRPEDTRVVVAMSGGENSRSCSVKEPRL